jgi:hypothetical protein
VATSAGALAGVAAPYIVMAAGLLLILGAIDMKYNVRRRAGEVKQKVDNQIAINYQEKASNINVEAVQESYATGVYRAIREDEVDQIADQMGIDRDMIMTEAELELYLKDPNAYMREYGKAHGWEW